MKMSQIESRVLRILKNSEMGGISSEGLAIAVGTKVSYIRQILGNLRKKYQVEIQTRPGLYPNQKLYWVE